MIKMWGRVSAAAGTFVIWRFLCVGQRAEGWGPGLQRHQQHVLRTHRNGARLRRVRYILQEELTALFSCRSSPGSGSAVELGRCILSVSAGPHVISFR